MFETNCVQIYFLVRKIMKLICNKLGNENQHMFKQITKNIYIYPFCKNLLDTYLKPKAYNEK
jgi:hypothetical protein